MSSKLMNLPSIVWTTMAARTKEAECQFNALGIMIIIGYLGFYIIWHNAFTQNYDNLSLRIIASLIGLSLILKKYWPEQIQRFIPIYWYLAMAYLFTFFFSFMLLKNNGSFAWQINLLESLTILVILTDWMSAISLIVIGASTAWVAYFFTTSHPEVPDIISSGTLMTYISIILFGGLFIHNKDKYQYEKLKAVDSASANVAHELRTPLAAISAGASALADYLPDLYQAYIVAKQQHLPIPTIYPDQFEQLKIVVTEIEEEVRRANSIIEMLLVNARQAQTINSEGFIDCSIASCIEDALRRYPFSSDEQGLIEWKNTGDFIFFGNQELTTHILFNLIKNAIYYVMAARKGNISIWLKTGDKFNYLHFKDTGSGMDKETLSHLFDRFYSKTYHGYGIGLSYCKNVMESYSGDISCKSINGEYAEFILKFPKKVSP